MILSFGYETPEKVSDTQPITVHYNQLGENNDITFMPHWHEAIEIIYLKKGLLKCSSDFSKISAKPGDIIYLSPYITHFLENITPSCYYLCLQADISIISDYGYLLSSSSVYVTNHPRIIASMDIIEDEFFHKSTNSELIIKNQLLSTLGYINRLSINSPSFMSNVQFDKIRKSITFINEHLKENISLKEISDYVGFSESHFSRCFHSVTKMSVITYLNLVRCKHAYHLISVMNKSVKEAAELSGFTNLSYFTKRFKNIYNMLPSQVPKQKNDV